MRPIGFVKRHGESTFRFTKGKIYSYFEIIGPFGDGDYAIKIKNDKGDYDLLEYHLTDGYHFEFYIYPEFPENVKDWTEDDWFQYDLKYDLI